MKANYGYADAAGEFFVTVDTERCDGCGDCVTACPRGLLVVVPDEWDEPKATLRPEHARSLGDLCPGEAACRGLHGRSCRAACRPEALALSF